jgi:uncharacterized protein YdhG (YjbR/CyaY superfamily)
MPKAAPSKKATSKRTTATTIDEYLALQTPEVREALQKLRKSILSAAPNAVEGISYQIPTFKLNGPLVGFAAFKNHCSFFVMNTGLVERYATKLKGFELGKGTIQFTVDRQVPVAVVKALVKARLVQNETGRLKTK